MPVEVVGRFVEQQDGGPRQEQGGEPQQHALTARHLPGGAVQADPVESEPVERGACPLLDVPVVADGREVLLAHVTRLDGVQGGPRAGDAQGLVDPQPGVQRGVLREVADATGGADGPGGRRQLAGQQFQQGRLARPVPADETGAAGADREVQPVEDGVPSGQAKARPAQERAGWAGGDDMSVSRLRGKGRGQRVRHRGGDRAGRRHTARATAGEAVREGGDGLVRRGRTRAARTARRRGCAAARCLRTSDEQRPAPIDDYRAERNPRREPVRRQTVYRPRPAAVGRGRPTTADTPRPRWDPFRGGGRSVPPRRVRPPVRPAPSRAPGRDGGGQYVPAP